MELIEAADLDDLVIQEFHSGLRGKMHIGATTATKPGCSYPKAVQQGLLSKGWLCVEEWLATANFGEYYSFPRTRVNDPPGRVSRFTF